MVRKETRWPLACIHVRRAHRPRQASLDIFWLKDESLSESENLPDPDVLAQEIVDDLEAALEQFREIAGDLSQGKPGAGG